MLTESANRPLHRIQQLRVVLSFASHVEKSSSGRARNYAPVFANSRKQTKYSFHFLEQERWRPDCFCACMRSSGLCIPILALATLTMACSSTPKSPDVAPGIRQSLAGAGLKGISVDQDRDKGVITLSGHVADENSRERAGAIASSMAQGQV